MRGGFGFCLGLTAPISVTNFSETFPKKNRGRYFVCASSFFIVKIYKYNITIYYFL